MNRTVALHVEVPTYQKLQKLAVLAGSESAAINRLLAFWENHSENGAPHESAEVGTTATWRSPTGDVLRVGARLEARDGGKSHFATVEQAGIRFDRKLYDSPSAAARAVKEKRGLVGPAANTNGRDFWRLRDPGSGRLVSIRDLKPRRGVDVTNFMAGIDLD